jgi:hypothetical protein
VQSERPNPVDRVRFTALAWPIADETWHVELREDPEVWTVVFDRALIEERIRGRVIIDLGLADDEFDLVVVESPRGSAR